MIREGRGAIMVQTMKIPPFQSERFYGRYRAATLLRKIGGRLMQEYLKFSEEVQHAIEAEIPIVALESTILSHGMPYPENLNTAKEVEAIVAAEGAMPATNVG